MEGIIIKNISNDYLVKSGNLEYLCRPRGKFRNMKLIPLVGDKVIFEGQVYESVIDGNVWSPIDNPTSWKSV